MEDTVDSIYRLNVQVQGTAVDVLVHKEWKKRRRLIGWKNNEQLFALATGLP